MDPLEVIKNITKTDPSYERYKFTESGVSPRGIPGYGNGLVDADSHTHTEKGEITEDPVIRKRTVQKRFKKLGLLRKAAIPPEFTGSEEFKYLVVSWGSNYYLIKEALENELKIQTLFLEFDVTVPIGQFKTRVEAFLEIIREEDLF